MTKHDILVELKRIASELGRIPSRDEVRQIGTIRERAIKEEFGGLRQALKAAGLVMEPKEKPSLAVRQYERQLVARAGVADLRQKFETEIMPWVGKWERDSDTLTLMVGSDRHAQWLDPWVDEVWWDVARRVQPSVIVYGGDDNDFWQVSSHSKNPRRTMTMQSEIDFVVAKMFRKAREVCPNAQIDWLLGNHEWRLFKYLCDQAPALSSLKCLQFDSLFSLKELEVNLVARPTFLTPSTKDKENYKIYNDCFAVTHGTSTGEHPAHKELRRWGISGISGHVHRFTVASQRDLRGMKTWITNGAMCQLKSGDEYIPDLVNWTQGFTIVHIRHGKVHMEYVDLSGDFACVGGVFYKRSARAGGVNQGLIAGGLTSSP